jgi:sterol desaturase/sphingolipid hydroxylase (fatty acid hydroxylase superfamily)
MVEYLEYFQTDILGQFLNPKKRLFWVYLATAFLISFLWLYLLRQNNVKQSIKTIFSPTVWLSRSSRLDVVCFLINRVFFIALRPMLLTQIAVATILYHVLHYQSLFPLGFFSDTPHWLSAFLFTICFFILDDFARFAVHYALHKIPILWEFHKFHHSAETLTPLTVTRAHPVEGLLFTLRSALVQGFTIAVFLFLFGQQISLVTVLGVNVFVILFHGLGSNLRHSHISVQYPQTVERILMSPAQHHLHHSSDIQHFDKNFGVALSIWDRMAGSFLHSTNAPFTFGIGVETKHYTRTIGHMYFLPFVRALNIIWHWSDNKKIVFWSSNSIPKRDVNKEFKETGEC